MLYTGYTKTELDALIHFLDQLQVPYNVHMSEKATESARQRGDSSILGIDIEDEALMAISPEHYPWLEQYRIYPQHLDVPLEHFQDPLPAEKSAAPVNKGGSFVKWVTFAMALGMILMAFASLKQ
jgi:hypothetical protein